MKKGKLLLATILSISFILGAFTSSYFMSDITAEDVKKAANIMGLEFTQPEVDSLLPGLEELRQDYEDNREVSIPNITPLALIFNPLPSGYVLNEQYLPGGFSNPGDVVRPEKDEDLAYMSIRELAELIRTKQISAVELTKFYIDRLEKYDSQLHCVVTITEELAMDQAARADKEIQAGKYKGMLHGIPYGAKDLFATKKYKTTWGAMPFKEQAFDYNATVVQRLEDAGAVLVAKTTLGALAWGDVWFGGKTRNPWDPESGSSGSSAGSASTVAAGLLPFALGTETLGSIVSPSTVCGVTGLRPTFGRVSRYGAMALSWSMDKIGPICRNAEDCAVVLNAIYGPDQKDRSVIQAPFNYNAGRSTVRNIRVGYLKKDFDADYPFKQQDSLTLNLLKSMGYELVPIELPDSYDLGFILSAEAAAAFDELTRSGADDQLVRQIKRAWPNEFRTSRFIPAVEYIQANRLRTQLIEDMAQLFRDNQLDLYVNPSWASASLYVTNLTGHPSITVPNGFKDGKPTSITFTGKLFEEGDLIAFAKSYQDRTAFHTERPKLE